MTFGSIVTPAFLATGVFNLDSSRFDRAPLDTRKEGWTETWGSDDDDEDEGDNTRSIVSYIDEQAIQMILATPHPQIPLVLTQFRPAYLEQLVLRIAGIPHIVINSNYISNEATGPLPYLCDYYHSSTGKSSPSLVGRHHPSNIAASNPICNNSILEYLVNERGIQLDASLTKEQRIQSKCFHNLIRTELQEMVTFLRYEDHDAWEQVYRGRYLEASSSSSSRRSWISNLKGRFQACMERAVARRKSMEYYHKMSIPQAVQRAKDAYQILEDHLTSHDDGQPYLLNTTNNKPNLVDAVLWAHLAEALSDVHLVIVLSSFPNLVHYFQQMYKTYFQGTLGDWDRWNIRQNLDNAFENIPIGDSGSKQYSMFAKSNFKDAIELMQSLSMRTQDLQEVLDTAKAKRNGESWPPARSPPKPTESMLYRWRMGEHPTKFMEKEEDERNQANNDHSSATRKKMIREQERNDQIWMSGVAGVSILVVLALQGASPQRS
eukprot:scaffold982_cov139-Cylindrotheca_fusiformis.AAC.4